MNIKQLKIWGFVLGAVFIVGFLLYQVFDQGWVVPVASVIFTCALLYGAYSLGVHKKVWGWISWVINWVKKQ